MSATFPPPPTPGVVVDSPHQGGRIDDHGGRAGSGERAVAYHCPYCAGEDLRPRGAAPGAWHCRGCMRAFTVTFLGVETELPNQTPVLAAPDSAPTGDPR